MGGVHSPFVRFLSNYLPQRTAAKAVELQSSLPGNLISAGGILRDRMRRRETRPLKGLGHMQRS